MNYVSAAIVKETSEKYKYWTLDSKRKEYREDYFQQKEREKRTISPLLANFLDFFHANIYHDAFVMTHPDGTRHALVEDTFAFLPPPMWGLYL